MEKEVRAAFAYVSQKLGLGRTVDFLFEETADNVQTAIMRADNEREAPNEWYVEYNPEKIIESMGKQGHSPTEYIRSLALHEILHLIAWDQAKLGEKGLNKRDKARLIELEEAMVRLLESLLRPLVIRCYCNRSKGKKPSRTTSTPLSFTGPNPHIGDTSQSASVIALEGPATSSSISEKSSTTPSATTTEGASPKGTNELSGD